MTGWSLRLALGIFLLANAAILAVAAYDRLGPAHGRLAVEECRLGLDPHADGLWTMLAGTEAPVSLPVAVHLLAEDDPRPTAERVAALGFTVDPAAPQPPPRTAYVALEAHGPAVDAYAERHPGERPLPLVIRDVALEAGRMERRYGERRGVAIARGIAAVRAENGTLRLAPRLRSEHLHIGRTHRRALAGFGPNPDAPCRSRFFAEIVFGAAHDPRLVRLRPIEPAPR